MANETAPKTRGANKPAPAASAPAVDPAAPPAGASPALDAATAAAAQVARAEPENAARAADAATGSALDAPGVGSGPAGREAEAQAAGIAPAAAVLPVAGTPGPAQAVPGPAGVDPGLYDTTGAHGSAFRDPVDPVDAGVSRAVRRPVAVHTLAGYVATGGKLGVTMPADPFALADAMDAGFDFVVVSKQEGRRRCGVTHPSVATLRRTQDFTSDELLILREDPHLVVQIVDPPRADRAP